MVFTIINIAIILFGLSLVITYIAEILGIGCEATNKETDTAKSEIYNVCVAVVFVIVIVFLYFKYNQSAELGLLFFRCFVGITGVRIVAEIFIGQNSTLKTTSIRVGVRLLSLMAVSVIFNEGRKLMVDVVLSLIKGVWASVLWVWDGNTTLIVLGGYALFMFWTLISKRAKPLRKTK